MGILYNGINGAITGKLGGMNTYVDKFGRQIIKTNGKKSYVTKAEKGNQQGTALISEFLNSVKDIIKIGFQNIPAGKKWHYYNHATSVNKKQAIKSIYPTKEIDYEKVMFSAGDIPVPKKPIVTLNNSMLEFTWEADLDTEGTDGRDQIMLIAYFPQNLKSIKLLSGARRTEEKERLQLPLYTKDMVIETYISYLSDDRKKLSDTIYTGQINWNK